MIVAGDHATNDMSGEDDDSWKSILEKEGYSVKCTLKGLGEIQAVRDILSAYQSRTGQTFRNPGLNAAGNQVYIQVKNYCSQQHASQDITSEPMSKGAYHIKFLLMWQLLLSFLFEYVFS